MDSMIGNDYETGLQNLKAIAEQYGAPRNKIPKHKIIKP
jgi:hypothetical protein